MTDTFLHIGYHKCASTHLQARFPQLGVPYRMFDRGELEAFQVAPERFTPPPVVETLRRQCAATPGQPLIISHEELSGHPNGRLPPSPFHTANNLARTFPNSRILIICRSQLDYLLSIYCFRVAIKGCEHLPLEAFLEREGPKGLWGKLKYDALIDHYRELFGPEKVTILPVELLRTNPDGWDELIFQQFLKVPTPPRPPKPVNESTRLESVLRFWSPINRVMWSALTVVGRGNPLSLSRPVTRLRGSYTVLKRKMTPMLNNLWKDGPKVSPSDDLRRKVHQMYAPTNARLSEWMGQSLKELGYP